MTVRESKQKRGYRDNLVPMLQCGKELQLQVIVMEHVQPEKEFSHALVELYWTKNSALIPQDWEN